MYKINSGMEKVNRTRFICVSPMKELGVTNYPIVDLKYKEGIFHMMH